MHMINTVHVYIEVYSVILFNAMLSMTRTCMYVYAQNHIYVCMYTHMHACMYTDREREGKRERRMGREGRERVCIMEPDECVCVHVYHETHERESVCICASSSVERVNARCMCLDAVRVCASSSRLLSNWNHLSTIPIEA